MVTASNPAAFSATAIRAALESVGVESFAAARRASG
jgi:hypothetical protein